MGGKIRILTILPVYWVEVKIRFILEIIMVQFVWGEDNILKKSNMIYYICRKLDSLYKLTI